MALMHISQVKGLKELCETLEGRMSDTEQVVAEVQDTCETVSQKTEVTYIDKKFDEVVSEAPEQLDTLQKLARAINDDENFAKSINSCLAEKLDKIGGTIEGDLGITGTLTGKIFTGKADTAGVADRALKADVCTGNASSASSVDWTGVKNKPVTFTPSEHAHSWSSITDKPSTFTPASHNHDSAYVKKAGDAVTGILDLKSTSTIWVTGRDVAPLRQKTWSQYSPLLSIKTQNGSWENGAYTDNILHWSYIADANYNNKTNTQTVDVQFKPNGEVVAPAFRGRLYGTADAANSVAWGNVSGRPSSMTPAFANGTWYNVGDDVKIGDFNHGGLLGICGLNAASGIGIAKKGAETDYASITYDGGNLVFNKTLQANITGSAGSVAWGNISGRPSSLPANGGTASKIAFNGRGNCEIREGNNDNAYGVGGGLNNLVIDSWWGVSFTSQCGGSVAKNTTAVGIDCRNGIVKAREFQGSLAWGNVSGKPSTFTPSSHNHAWGNITGAPATATRWPSWAEVTGKPTGGGSITAQSWGQNGYVKFANGFIIQWGWRNQGGKFNFPITFPNRLFGMYTGVSDGNVSSTWEHGHIEFDGNDNFASADRRTKAGWSAQDGYRFMWMAMGY